MSKPTTSTARRLGLTLAAAIAVALPVREARADYWVPTEGDYTLNICSGNLGSGICASAGNLPLDEGFEWTDFTELPQSDSPTGTFNDATNSYVVCNSTDGELTVNVYVYRTINLKNEFQHDTLVLEPQGCEFVNLTETDASSIEITP